MPDNRGVIYFILRKMQAVDERESRLRTALQVIEIQQILLRFCNRICYHVYSLSGNGSSSDNQTSHKLCHSLVCDSSSEKLQCCKIVNEGMNMSATGRVCFTLAFDDTAHYFGKWLHSVEICNNPIQKSGF